MLDVLLGEAMNAAEFGIFVFDDDGNYVAANAYGASLLGTSVEDLLRRRAGDFTVGNPPPADINPTSHRESTHMIRRADDGEWVPLAFVVVPTRVSGMPFRVAVVWPLAEDDPRATAAAARLTAQLDRYIVFSRSCSGRRPPVRRLRVRSRLGGRPQRWGVSCHSRLENFRGVIQELRGVL
jgi:PAS domain-containing protein